jgi:hypothetical protein
VRGVTVLHSHRGARARVRPPVPGHARTGATGGHWGLSRFGRHGFLPAHHSAQSPRLPHNPRRIGTGPSRPAPTSRPGGRPRLPDLRRDLRRVGDPSYYRWRHHGQPRQRDHPGPTRPICSSGRPPISGP